MGSRRRPRGDGGLQHLGGDRYRSAGINALGRRVTKVHHAATKTDAIAMHRRWMVAIGSATADPGTRTLNDLIDEWWRHHSPELAPTSRYRYERLMVPIRNKLGPVRLDRITVHVLETFYREHPPYQAHRYSSNILHPAFEAGTRWGWIAHNPAARATLPKIRKAEPKAPTLAEVDAFTRHLLDHGPAWFGVFVHLLGHTGCRKGEILGLRWNDIDWQTGVIRIARNVAITPATGILVKEPKTQRSRRYVQVGAGTLELLHEYGDQQDTADGFDDRRFRPWLFPGDPAAGDLPLSPNVIDKTFNKARLIHPFPYRLHDIRHAVASHLLGAGHSIAAVSEQLGHSSSTVTLSVYAHSLPTDRGAIAASLERPTLGSG